MLKMILKNIKKTPINACDAIMLQLDFQVGLPEIKQSKCGTLPNKTQTIKAIWSRKQTVGNRSKKDSGLSKSHTKR
jgi:hypothetical protein